MNCLFCKIAAGNSPAKIFYDDKEIMIFADIMPRAEIHLLVCPKAHYKTLLDIPDDLLMKVINRIRVLATELGLEDNFRLILNNGAHSGQIVEHLHFHFMSNAPNVDLRFKSQSIGKS